MIRRMSTPPLVDTHGRTINYLRLSVTDRCNLRCSYCMPAEGVVKRDHHEILSFEELYEIAACATSLGVRKIRVTGGEPLVRKGILAFLQSLSGLSGLDELVLTTNGTLLSEMAEDLRTVGVRRLNISLDSMRAETFASITRKDNLVDVLSGIEAARSCGLPVKINTVVMGGVNDEEILDFVRLTLDQRISVRFIEYMPVMKAPGWQDLLIPGQAVLSRITRRYRVDEVATDRLSGPAKMYRVAGASGTFGVITPLSGHFCDYCNRIRVAADGYASSCLFSDRRVDLRPWLGGVDDGRMLESTLRQMIGAKPARHRLSATEADHTPFVMSNIGG